MHPQVVAIRPAEAVFVSALALGEDLRQAGKDARRVVRMDMVEPEIGVGHHVLRPVAQHVQRIGTDEGHLEVAAGHRAVDDGGGIVDEVLQALQRIGRFAGAGRRCAGDEVKVLEFHARLPFRPRKCTCRHRHGQEAWLRNRRWWRQPYRADRPGNTLRTR